MLVKWQQVFLQLNNMNKMGMEAFISSKCVQTAVYWGNPVNDGYGGHTFDDPVEIACRWEDKDQVVGTQVGGEVTGGVLLSRSIVFVTQDLDEEGYLYLGSLDDLSVEQQANPKLVETAYIIKRFEKTPALGSTTEFLRKAFLTPYLR
jgi:hypothetical protein